MSLVVVVGLLLQGVAVALLRIRLGKGWLGRPFSLLVVAAVLYHGVSEVLLSFPSVERWSVARNTGIPQASIDTGMFVVSLALLALVVGYLVGRPSLAPEATPEERAEVARVIDWRVAAVASVPLLVATVQGRGYITGSSYSSSASGLTEGLAQQFLIPLLVLASFGFVVRHGGFLPVLAAQTLLLTVTGQRLEIFVAAAALVVLLARAGIRPSRRSVAGALVVTALLAVAITSVRTTAGRDLYYSDTGFASRLSAVADAVPNTFSGDESAAGPGLVSQAAARFDANSYAGAVQRQLDDGRSPLGVGLVLRSLLQPIPSVLYPAKLSGALYDREPENAAVVRLGVPNIDYLPGFVGMYLAALGWWLPVLMLLLGWLFCRVEGWALARFTPARVVVLAALAIGAMFYERGVPGFLVQARMAIPLGLAVLALAALPRLRRSPSGALDRRARGVHPG